MNEAPLVQQFAAACGAIVFIAAAVVCWTIGGMVVELIQEWRKRR